MNARVGTQRLFSRTTLWCSSATQRLFHGASLIYHICLPLVASGVNFLLPKYWSVCNLSIYMKNNKLILDNIIVLHLNDNPLHKDENASLFLLSDIFILHLTVNLSWQSISDKSCLLVDYKKYKYFSSENKTIVIL